MKKGFIYNHDKTKLVNVNHIITVSLESPCFEQKEYVVVANLTYGNEILFTGTETECKNAIEKIYNM